MLGQMVRVVKRHLSQLRNIPHGQQIFGTKSPCQTRTFVQNDYDFTVCSSSSIIVLHCRARRIAREYGA